MNALPVSFPQGEGSPPVGVALIPERVAVGPTPFPGNFGTHSANSYNVLLGREQSAPSQFSLPPAASASLGGGGGGSP